MQKSLFNKTLLQGSDKPVGAIRLEYKPTE